MPGTVLNGLRNLSCCMSIGSMRNGLHTQGGPQQAPAAVPNMHICCTGMHGDGPNKGTIHVNLQLCPLHLRAWGFADEAMNWGLTAQRTIQTHG